MLLDELNHKREQAAMLDVLAPIGRAVTWGDVTGVIAGRFGVTPDGGVVGWVRDQFGFVSVQLASHLRPSDFGLPTETKADGGLSFRDVAVVLLTKGWTVEYRPLSGFGPWEWRSPAGMSGSEYRSYSCEMAPEKVMQEAYKAGHIGFTQLVK